MGKENQPPDASMDKEKTSRQMRAWYKEKDRTKKGGRRGISERQGGNNELHGRGNTGKVVPIDGAEVG